MKNKAHESIIISVPKRIYGNRKGRFFYIIGELNENMKTIDDYIISIPDYPQKGVLFRDITSVIQHPDGLKLAIDEIEKLLEGVEYDAIVAPESRGFIFGTPVAYNNGKSLVLARKKGKLPRKTLMQEYDLEYGRAIIEIHADALKPGQKVVIIDDLMATGGTFEAIAKLVEKAGAEVVKIVALIELKGLKGRQKLKKYDVACVQAYEGK